MLRHGQKSPAVMAWVSLMELVSHGDVEGGHRLRWVTLRVIIHLLKWCTHLQKYLYVLYTQQKSLFLLGSKSFYPYLLEQVGVFYLQTYCKEFCIRTIQQVAGGLIFSAMTVWKLTKPTVGDLMPRWGGWMSTLVFTIKADTFGLYLQLRQKGIC